MWTAAGQIYIYNMQGLSFDDHDIDDIVNIMDEEAILIKHGDKIVIGKNYSS